MIPGMKKKTCHFEENNISHIDYKDTATLVNFTNAHGRLIAARHTGVKAKSQRKLAQAIKRSRFMGLLPFVQS